MIAHCKKRALVGALELTTSWSYVGNIGKVHGRNAYVHDFPVFWQVRKAESPAGARILTNSWFFHGRRLGRPSPSAYVYRIQVAVRLKPSCGIYVVVAPDFGSPSVCNPESDRLV